MLEFLADVINEIISNGMRIYSYFIFILFFSSARNCGTQPTTGSANRHRRDARMSRGILSKVYQLLGQKSNKNVDGRVRLYFYFL